MIAVYVFLALAVLTSAQTDTSSTEEIRVPTETCFDLAGESICRIFSISCNDPNEMETARTQCAFTCRRC